MPRATWLFSGKGTVLFDRYSTCDVQPEALVIAGVDEHDDISLVLNRQSQINIGTGEATKPAARLSCAKGRVRLKVLRGAHMSVASGSILELNMRDGVAAPGIIEELCFRHGGALHLAKDSRLLFAENKREPRIRWTQERGGIYGEGLVGMNTMRHNSRLECGVLQQRTFFDKKKSVQTFARNIVASLINLTDSLHSTLYFVNSSETSMIHTKGHVIVPLKPGESIDHDNTSGTVWGTRVSGSKTVEFRLNAQGKPQ